MMFRLQLHFAELTPIDIGNAIMLGELLIGDHIIGVQEIDHAAILIEHVLKHLYRFPAHRFENLIVISLRWQMPNHDHSE